MSDEEDTSVDAEVSNIFTYMLWFAWSLLTLTPTSIKNPIYATILATQDIMENLMVECDLEFAPGLLDVLKATTPLSIAYFKSLPTEFSKRWGVYLLVLTKPMSQPRVHVGFGTNAELGVRSRPNNYNTKTLLPRFVKEALDEGYVIVHKDLLCRAPKPVTDKIGVQRSLPCPRKYFFVRALGNGVSDKRPWHALHLPLVSRHRRVR
jgi:hypothetical protein